ncbi:ABC-2 transporter permease [Staphylococcus pettenkoferi]|uniref:ABC-2 transporter permease n=2 Tax=Staphylococcus pettenkoferi TaxID=170573 RepID=UPI002275575E|nr:ABC-2 transporter permease [Staphylococcus pettenkoferi]MCY1571761.1 ABC-2 transporter permease [Staphylococcus pettenkoferi]MCY1605672.1 ABC-2 transporter permease [Staphylococcus pettenkoferi]MDH9615790.1 ABC-2 transporter permease [Staphylococcus pettenkoferi]
MKGLMMNHWALSKKSVCIYLPIAVVICVLFNIGQQGMTGGFLPCYLLAIIALDNLKNEKGSDWPKLALTLPLNRKMYVQSHFLFYLLLAVTGGVLVFVVTSILQVSIIEGFIALFIGVGITAQLTLMYPLMYKYGSENSNGIMMLAILPVILIYIIYSIALTIIASIGHDEPNQMIMFIGSAIYFVISLFLAALIYWIAVKVFKSLAF